MVTLNAATAPDENLWKRITGTYTLWAKDNAVQFTESDVKAAARVLTGWRINAKLH
jgi:uncharacterized protein (DUF1800 family)